MDFPEDRTDPLSLHEWDWEETEKTQNSQSRLKNTAGKVLYKLAGLSQNGLFAKQTQT